MKARSAISTRSTMQQLLVEQHYLSAGGADGIFGGGTEKVMD